MIPISADLEKAFQTGQLRPDEYLAEESGLICCSRCHTPRQSRFDLGGKRYEPRCMCACQREAWERQEQDRKQREFLDQVSRNRSVGLPDPELCKHTFANDLGYNPEQMQKAKAYVQNWEAFHRTSTGLLLRGGVGTGKSYIAGCIANALVDKGVRVLMTNFTRLLNRLTDFYAGDRNSYIDGLNRYSLLIIDDLGVERDSEFAREQVFSVIDSRYRSQMPMIVTTNLTLNELKHPAGLARARIYERVLERCVPIRVNDQNVRKQMAAEQMEMAKNLLRGDMQL